MGSLRQFWNGLFSRGNKSDAPAPEQLEREISAISSDNQTLADDMQRIRKDLEHTRDEEDRKIARLEQVRQSMERAREEDHRKLVEFDTVKDRLLSATDADNKRIEELEKRLSGIEAERDEVRRQARVLEESLAEASSRLEKTDAELKGLHEQAKQQARMLEDSLAEAASRLEKTTAELESLQEESKQQTSQFRESLTEAGSRIEATDSQLRELEERLDGERRDNLTILQQMQAAMRKQDSRMGWTMAAAAFAMLLGATAGGILIWDVQKNASMLSGMSADIRELMTSMNGHLSRRHSEPVASRQEPVPPTPVAAPESSTTVAVEPQGETLPETESSAPSTSATIKKPKANPYFLSSALERGRPKQAEGLKQSTRSEVDVFFEKNAKLEGVISLPSGVQYRIVKPGSGISPQPGDKVVVRYVSTTMDGTIFDETYTSDEPSVYTMNELQPGWREALLKMEEGAEFELYVPPEKAATSGSVRKRGMLGYEPSIYLIELLQVLRDGVEEPSTSAN